ncbi:hypothetical protein L1049_025084 [Liquidambar formosana]|uniref:Protein Lines C-terminal domain-containing protein n=1 Tax=Liquidambar formosana TaxID=63359 RepID=A0AAP0RWR7_LIQFO
MSSRHLQRQTVFLFLRCSFSLISLREETDEKCACATQNSCLTFDSSSDLECCSRKKGFSELYEWLQGYLPTDKFVDYEMYLEKCRNFALSFLQLFMHEDDILFEVLLQLLSVPFCSEQHCCRDGGSFQEVKEDILFHVSNLFNPVHLFHLFLAELHYDHQVLLDYLISKDTGISCAEYLLRCLRTVSDSWHVFVEFSMCEKVLNRSSCKKRKVFLDGSNSQVELSSALVKGDGVALSLEEVCESDHKFGSKHYRTKGQPFKEAKECMLSLKCSIENLHQKNLFPYNPEVLLKRLVRFQELSIKQEKYYLSKNG